ncbi:hypothetical protein [Flavobacterium sp. HSC-61S13]|uniref:hypothetical protein n=1 Tax=Flavobacterium sp. HSC-61S13 TaxID=2910963 RepID=UPI00209EDA95|nr:hypothetical protein [Flavobacterium sp. HSC-61S13]MCP1996677.1 hypothetical protein [Flavobacterium sp. HSC-61S13]
MKARAWLFSLLFCLFSIAGFGFNSSDLAKNSKIEAVISSDVSKEVKVVLFANADVLATSVYFGFRQGIEKVPIERKSKLYTLKSQFAANSVNKSGIPINVPRDKLRAI